MSIAFDLSECNLCVGQLLHAYCLNSSPMYWISHGRRSSNLGDTELDAFSANARFISGSYRSNIFTTSVVLSRYRTSSSKNGTRYKTLEDSLSVSSTCLQPRDDLMRTLVNANLISQTAEQMPSPQYSCQTLAKLQVLRFFILNEI